MSTSEVPDDDWVSALRIAAADPRSEPDPDADKYVPRPGERANHEIDRLRLLVYLSLGTPTPLVDQFTDAVAAAAAYPDPLWFRSVRLLERKFLSVKALSSARRINACRTWCATWLTDLVRDDALPVPRRRAAMIAVLALALIDQGVRAGFRTALRRLAATCPDIERLVLDVADGVALDEPVRLLRAALGRAPPPLEVTSADGLNEFARTEAGWRIVFGGATRYYPRLAGYRDLAELLSRRNETVWAYELVGHGPADPRPDPDARRRAARTVGARVNRALNLLGEHQPELWRHLREHLRLGLQCLYAPPDDHPPWVVTL